ncbi:hypothetical protein CQW23_16031 [Capsicum baccatum]|uniref:Uncharacterized protein n=1 Tax=Capsicum baccatum TaxID=33114 RepID=A0A2G2WNQ6_CAPBA|nr:hypothetical protein CQW23_16031 [Capsicum baccatum]
MGPQHSRWRCPKCNGPGRIEELAMEIGFRFVNRISHLETPDLSPGTTAIQRDLKCQGSKTYGTWNSNFRLFVPLLTTKAQWQQYISLGMRRIFEMTFEPSHGSDPTIRQGFQINSNILEFIKNHRATLEKVGLLMPGILVHVNLKEAYDLLRKSYFLNKDIKNVYCLSDIFKELEYRVQTARYEDFIIRLASAYEGYDFYLPAFMDFRGRIYHSGILHFHEHDLARSFILFSNNPQEVINQSTKDIVATSVAFKYKKFDLYDNGLKWYKENHSLIYASD